MKCPKCKADTSVKDSRDHKLDHNETTRRRRRCKKCGHRFSTVEILWEPMIKPAGLPKHAPAAGYKSNRKDLPKGATVSVKKKRRSAYDQQTTTAFKTQQAWHVYEIDVDTLSDEALEQAIFEGRVNAD